MLDALLDLLLPRACAACERGLDSSAAAGEVVCGTCWSRLRLLPAPRCARCGHPRLGDAECRWCAILPPFVRAVRSVCWAPEGSGGAIVHALKYGGWQRVAEGMGRRMARLDFPADVVRERSALLPIPLATVRERERGFNQSTLLAKALAGRWQLPLWTDVVRRTRATESQTRLTPAERSSNVEDCFAVVDGARLEGAHVVLVDDVVTTASTLNACATACFDAGARIVSYATFGRARMPGDRDAPMES